MTMLKRMIPAIVILAIVNGLGYFFHADYTAAVVGPAAGVLVGFVVSEIKVRQEN